MEINLSIITYLCFTFTYLNPLFYLQDKSYFMNVF